MKRFLSSLFVIAAATNMAVAGDKPDFSGKWKLDLEKSALGAMPPPESMIRTVIYKGAEISVHQLITGPEMTLDFTYFTDGKESANNFMGADFKSKAHWDGNTLVIQNEVGNGGEQGKSTNKWSLSADGKTFTDVLSISSPQGDMEMTYVLVKQ